MDINKLSPGMQQALLEKLKKGEITHGIGNSALELAGLLGEGTTAYTKAADKIMLPAVRGAQGFSATKLGGMGGVTAARMAGNPIVTNILRAGPGVAAVGGVLGAADVLAGPDSLGNKAMDATAMGIGGFLGMAGGPLGAAAGAGVGKAASDGLQWLFGDKKTAEQRQMENALLNLQGGNY
tara:strand:- start:2157 stop:2699 length:543 start_codon:yes stop_codon:yes gene_type:complete